MQFSLAATGGLPLCCRLFLELPLGTQIHLKSHLRAHCAQRCARERPLTRKGGPLGAQGCHKVPKWSQNGGKWTPRMHLKSKLLKKSAESGLGLLFTIFFHYRHPPKTSLFDTSEQAKCRSFPHGASDAASELQNDADGAEKWREWALSGFPRVPKSAPNAS